MFHEMVNILIRARIEFVYSYMNANILEIKVLVVCLVGILYNNNFQLSRGSNS